MEEDEPEERDAIDLSELYDSFYVNRVLIYKITGIFVFFGLLIAIFSSVEYNSEALLMPEIQQNQNQAQSLISQYGGLLGLGGGSANSYEEGSIKPAVYPKIIHSISFQDTLLHQKIYIPDLDTTLNGYQYFGNFHRSFNHLIWKYTFGLPQTLGGSPSTNMKSNNMPASIRDKLDKGSINVSREQLAVIDNMRTRISITIDTETGILHVQALMPDPVAAAQICENVIQMLKTYITDYSTQKAKEDLKFAELQHRQAKTEFANAQNSLAKFQDQNLNLATAKSKTRQKRLQAQYDLTYNLYNNVTQQLMQAKMQVQQQKPVFKIIQSANIPVDKSQPRRLLILVVSFVVGLIVSFLYIAGKITYRNLTAKDSYNESK